MKHLVLGMLITALLLAVFGTAFAADKPDKGTAKYSTVNLQTLSGTVKNLVLPGDTSAELATFTLAGDKDSVSAKLGPCAYLKKLGLTLANDKPVKATGWTITEKGVSNFLVRDLVVDDKIYTFRDDHGKAVWSEYIAYPIVTITGKVKDLVVPELTVPATTPAATTAPATTATTTAAAPAATTPTHKAPQNVTFTLVTDTESIPVQVTTAKGYAAAGLQLKEGDTIAVTGWKVTTPAGTGKHGKPAESHLVAQSITAGDKTCTLRDADGKAAWPQATPHHGKRK